MSGTLIYLCFFLSGTSALIYEIVWSRLLIRLLGSSLYAVAAITSIFLAGLALGAALPAILDRRPSVVTADSQSATGETSTTQRPTDPPFLNRFNPLGLYAALELAIALWGCLIPALLASGNIDALAAGTAGNAALSYVVRFLIATCVLLPPTCLMGLSFPVLIHSAGADHRRKRTEILYAINTFGAVLGASISAFVLMPALGLFLTSVVAAALNCVAALIAFLLKPSHVATGESSQTEPTLVAAQQKKSRSTGAFTSLKFALMGAFAAGFCAMAFEVTWTRFFALLLGSSIYSFSIVLVLFLSGLTFGAWLVARFLTRANQPLIFIASGLAFSAIYTVTLMYFADELPWLFLSVAQGLTHVAGHFSFEVSLLARILTIAVCVAPPAMALGVVLPLFFHAAETELEGAKRAGLIYAVNTGGGIFGALVTGFLLIPGLSLITISGIQSTALFICCLQIFLASWIFLIWSNSFVSDAETRMIVNGAVLFVIVAAVGDIAFFRPSWNPRIMSAGPTFYMPSDIAALTRESFLRSIGAEPETERNTAAVLFYRDGLNATVTVDRNALGTVIYLKNDGKVEAALPTSLDKPNGNSDVSTHVLLGALPELVHFGPCDRTLVIGYGSGTTSGATLSFPEVKHLEIAELEPAVYDASTFFTKVNNDPLRADWISQGRVTKFTNDGRFVLSSARTPYDAIISQPADPWVNGSSELFTREFWQLGKSRLSKDGIFCQWIQLYSLSPEYFGILCRTFHEVFPAAMLFHSPRAGECILVGFNGRSNFDGPSMDKRISAATDKVLLISGGLASHSQIAGLTKLDWSGIKKMCTAIAAQTHDARLNTDDNLLVEYAAATNAMTQEQNIESNIGFIQKFAGK